MPKNSIYKALRTAVNGNFTKRKIAIAYLYGVLKGNQRKIFSENPLVDEGQNVYVTIEGIGRHTLEYFDECYVDHIKARLNEDHIVVSGTVEEKIIQIFENYGFDDSLDKIGSAVMGLLKQEPNFGKSVEEIAAGCIQRHEQKAILKALSKYK